MHSTDLRSDEPTIDFTRPPEVRVPGWKVPRNWLIGASVFLGGALVLSFLYFFWVLPRYNDLRHMLNPQAATSTPARTMSTPTPDAVTATPTTEPSPDDTASPSDEAGDPTSTPSATPSPTLVVRWRSIDTERACKWGAGSADKTVKVTVTKVTATAVTCTRTITVEQPVGGQDAGDAAVAAYIGQHACNGALAIFDFPKIWYCQPGPPESRIPITDWATVCDQGSIAHAATAHPSCITVQAKRFTLRVNDRLNTYCIKRGYTAAASGNSPHTPQNRPYCKDQS